MVNDFTYPELNFLSADAVHALTEYLTLLGASPTTRQDFDIERCLVERIANRGVDEAFHVLDLGHLVSKYIQWVQVLPRVKPCYAVKCNPNPVILQVLRYLGCGFDCASRAEIQLVKQLKGTPSDRFCPSKDIVFANPCKQTAHIRFASSHGVHRMTFDNVDELHKIKETNPDAELILRIITDDSNSLCRFSSKFGAPMEDVERLIRTCADLNLNLIGVSFHVGSGCASPIPYRRALRDARLIFDLAKSLGLYEMYLVDIGGGYPGSDDPDVLNGAPTISEIAVHINEELDELFPADEILSSGRQYELIAEPGRYFVSESHTLACNIYAKRNLSSAKNELMEQSTKALAGYLDSAQTQVPEVLYYLNDGVYHSFNCIMFDHQHPIPNPLTRVTIDQVLQSMFKAGIKGAPAKLSNDSYVDRSDDGSSDESDDSLGSSGERRATLFGPTCDSLDCIARNVLLPELHIGDWLYFRNMGAYTTASTSHFNGMECGDIEYIFTF